MQVTDQSGPAITGASGTIRGSSLEGSNTDIADEFTKLIVTQQAYSANTKVITTANNMVQDLAERAALIVGAPKVDVNRRRANNMGLSSALATAMSGLRANQAALSIISSNIANAQTPGYVTQNPNQIEMPSGSVGSSVTVTGVNRTARYLRAEPAAHGDLGRRLRRPDRQHPEPAAERLRHARRRRHAGKRAATISPPRCSRCRTARAVLGAERRRCPRRRRWRQQLNSTTQGIQALRSNVEQDIGNSASQANATMSQIAQINTQLQGLSPTDPRRRR